MTVAYTTDLAAAEANAADFDAAVIPGGSAPEELRVNEDVVRFVKELDQHSKVVAEIGKKVPDPCCVNALTH
ncbi:DJ-1/PfpI family protein [Neobacillus drentensis]|uniref:DJ-1/PfpI family protein n=1 Tax=Neobacillus drentensis TaxID=220684 RepID=UPI000825B4C1|nr:DJ-1/PfpI family protein [Neobacillus drentensis]